VELVVNVAGMVGVLVLTIVGVRVGARDAVGVSFTNTVSGVGDNLMTTSDLRVALIDKTNRLNKTVRRMTILRVIRELCLVLFISKIVSYSIIYLA
jgi:hypothetical protein